MHKLLRKLKFKLTPKSKTRDHFSEPKKKPVSITLMRGLPASGKSTKAKEIIQTKQDYVRVNKDLLREMLHFNIFTGKREQLTQKVMRAVVKVMVEEGQNVIMDETHMNPKTFNSNMEFAKELSPKVDVVDFGTPIEECIERDLKRGDKMVGKDVIVGMAMQNKQYDAGPKGIMIFDIDGTLANIEHRKHFVTGEGKKDWKGFFDAMDDDTVYMLTRNMYEDAIEKGYSVFLVSGRPSQYRTKTEKWLLDAGLTAHKALFMRPHGDHRPDTEVKQEIYDRYLKHYNVVRVIDDRPSVIRMWRNNGLDVVDVGDGVEF